MAICISYSLLIGSALILAGIGVIIAFLGEKACLSSQCVGQGRFINRAMNREVDPCDDFYSFVCGNFPKYGTSIVDEIERTQLYRLVRYLEVTADWEEDARIEHIAKSLYQNCINDTQLEVEGLKPLQRTITRIGSIPFLDRLWDYENKVEFTVVDNDLKHFFNGFSAVFVYNRMIQMKHYPSLNPKILPSEEKKKEYYSAYSVPPHLYTAEAPNPENYLKYCIEFNDLYSTILLTNKTITDVDIQEIKEAVNFKIKFLKLIDKSRNCSEQPFKFVEVPYDTKFGKEDPDAIAGNHGLFDLQLYAIRKAQPGEFGGDFVVITPHFENYISELKELLKEFPNRVLANYMGIEALIQMTPYLPRKFRDIYNKYFKSERDNNNKILLDRHLQCAKIVKDAMTTGLTATYLKDNPQPPDEVPVLNSVTNQLMLEVRAIFKNIKWASNKDRSKMFNLVNKIKIVSPLSPYVLELMQNETAFDLFHQIMCYNEDSTLETYLNVKNVNMLRNAQITNKPSITGETFPLTIFHSAYDLFDTEIYYQLETNEVVVPMAYLFYPSIDSLWPKYLSFGGVSVWIARLLIKTLSSSNIVYPEIFPEKPIKQNWWDANSVSRYEHKRQCALDDYNKYLKPFKVKCNDANCMEETLYTAAAVKAAYLAYKENTRLRFFVEPRIPYLTKYNVDQIFFMKYASSFCRYEDPGIKWYKSNRDTALVSSNFTVLYTLRNFPKFREVFECQKDDKMWKSEPCKVWPYSGP